MSFDDPSDDKTTDLRDREAVHAECENWGEDRVQAYVDAHPNDAKRMYRLEWLNIKARAANKQWAAISPAIQQAIKTSWAFGVPPMTTALYGRWWQLETWLRSLIYVELKAKFGAQWVEELRPQSESRQLKEHGIRYMATPDAQSRLAYADASELFKIIEDHWDLFESVLLPSKNVWLGRVEELREIRNRIGHCRRPHADDLARLEQTLRDLNGGAFRAAAAFNRQFEVDENWTDAVVEKWGRTERSHAGLITHAERQYNILFHLRYSRRPWVQSSLRKETISGTPGYIWHAYWLHSGTGAFILRRFWQDIWPFHNTILMLCTDNPSSIEVSFSAMEDPNVIADAINECFHTALRHRGSNIEIEDFEAWKEGYAEIDPRVQVVTAWAAIEPSMHDVSIFGA